MALLVTCQGGGRASQCFARRFCPPHARVTIAA